VSFTGTFFGGRGFASSHRMILGLVLLAMIAVAEPGRALLLDPHDRFDVPLDDGRVVVVYRAASEPHGYYYLPSEPRLASAEDGTPEFSFLKFISDRDSSTGIVSGAVLHLQVTWGLDVRQEDELRRRLLALRPGADLRGAVPVESTTGERSFRVVSATLDGGESSSRVLASGRAPILAGGRAAVAASLNAIDAQLLAATLEKTESGAESLGDLSLVLDYDYHTEWPAARGEITIDWARLQSQGDALRRSHPGSNGCFLAWCPAGTAAPALSYDEVRSQFEKLVVTGVVTYRWDEELPDERLAEIEEAFFTRFLDLTAETVLGLSPETPPAAERRQHPGLRFGRRFSFARNRTSKVDSRRRVQKIPLDVSLPVRRSLQIVGNLGQWYQSVRDNPRCVAEVRIDDPFDEIRAVPFVLDFDGEKLFQKVLRHVEVKLRRRRSAGRDYMDAKTIDADFLRREGLVAYLSYAKGSREELDEFEYQTQWSLENGGLFPRNPPWRSGNWEGVTLTPPVEPRLVEFEGDLAEMEAAGMTRATLKIRYSQFGREAEESLRLRLRGSPWLQKQLFVDRGSPGFAYRLIFQHRREGALALPWKSRVNSDFVYASIPTGLFENPSALARARAGGAAELAGDEEEVLDRFPELRTVPDKL
jgi:hypothetical protein